MLRWILLLGGVVGAPSAHLVLTVRVGEPAVVFEENPWGHGDWCWICTCPVIPIQHARAPSDAIAASATLMYAFLLPRPLSSSSFWSFSWVLGAPQLRCKDLQIRLVIENSWNIAASLHPNNAMPGRRVTKMPRHCTCDADRKAGPALCGQKPCGGTAGSVGLQAALFRPEVWRSQEGKLGKTVKTAVGNQHFIRSPVLTQKHLCITIHFHVGIVWYIYILSCFLSSSLRASAKSHPPRWLSICFGCYVAAIWHQGHMEGRQTSNFVRDF